MQAITQGTVPSFPPQPENERNTIREKLEETSRRCWTSDPSLRLTMHDIVRDLKHETWILQEDQSPKHLGHNNEISDLGRAL